MAERIAGLSREKKGGAWEEDRYGRPGYGLQSPGLPAFISFITLDLQSLGPRPSQDFVTRK